ncbi:hypothetical protein [uncultured Sphaerochaeta sp.]
MNRYQRESFWAASGLYEYVQIFHHLQRDPIPSTIPTPPV